MHCDNYITIHYKIIKEEIFKKGSGLVIEYGLK